MIRAARTGRLIAAVVLSLLAALQPVAGQAKPSLGAEEIQVLAAIHVAISQAHDSIDAQLAQPRNKTAQAQAQLQERLRSQVEGILKQHGLTEEEYNRRKYLVSTDGDVRKTFDEVVSRLTGLPTPGRVAAPAAVAVPAGAAGAHIGHVVNAFGETPDGMGLLPAALAEARIAAQHAGLAARSPASLESMQLHAGHVIHALDPTVVTTGPGRGYGVKRAALGVATHMELAAKAEGAPAVVVTHAVHIAASAKSTAQRSEQVIAVARQVQAATTAAAAATMVGQMVSLCDQLVAGADLNADGRVGWDSGEGGLQQVQQHVNLMLAAERPGSRSR